jgi:ATP-dependent 26S proteasome regulatory subunit
MTLEQENEAFEKIWDDLMDEHQIKPESPPKGFVLGGQPGAGKSNLIKMINGCMFGRIFAILSLYLIKIRMITTELVSIHNQHISVQLCIYHLNKI